VGHGRRHRSDLSARTSARFPDRSWGPRRPAYPEERPTTEIPFTGRPSRFAHDDNDIIVRDDRQIRVIDATQALHELGGRLAALLTTDAVDEHHAEWTFGVSHGART
jgi:hypothetical protein